MLKKFSESKIRYYVENIIVVGLLMYCIKALTDYDNMPWQTWKNQAGAKAVFAMAAVIFIVRRVRLINWQSLLGTVLFVPFVIERFHFWRESPDILAILKPQMAAEWIALMIIIDMLVYGNVVNFAKSINLMFILYAVMTLGMFYRRNGKMEPVLLVIPIFLFALVKLNRERLEWFLKRFTDSWFLIFVYVCVRSFKENPFTGRRYFGYFLDIGPFGIFMVCTLVMAIFALLYAREKYGRKSFFYIASIVWIVASSYMLWIIDTRTILSGVFFLLVFMYVYARKDVSGKALKKRGIIVGITILGIIILCVIGLAVFAGTDSPYWYGKAEGKGLKSLIAPLYMHASRFADAMNINKDATLWQQFVEIVDRLSSGRITIAKAFSPYFNYEGNGPIGLEVQGYWAYNAHNNFVQILLEYGWFTLIEFVTLVIMGLVTAVKRYLKSDRSPIALLPVMWLAAMLGVWCGEVSSIYYPATFFGLMFISRLTAPEGENE